MFDLLFSIFSFIPLFADGGTWIVDTFDLLAAVLDYCLEYWWFVLLLVLIIVMSSVRNVDRRLRVGLIVGLSILLIFIALLIQ